MGAHNHVRRLWFTVSDPVSPQLSIGGELLSGGTRRGTETLTVNTFDQAGGLDSVSVSINGHTVASSDWCSPPGGVATTLTPCPSTRAWSLPISTENSPWVNGLNSLIVCARDYATNAQCASRVVMVDNTCPASGGAEARSLVAGIQLPGGAGGLSERAVLRSRQAPIIRGHLATDQGVPLPGATVCIFESIALPDAGPELVAIPRTAANGNFTTALDPGPSRRLAFVYRFNNRIQTDSAEIRSVVVPTLRIEDKTLTNGDNARFPGLASWAECWKSSRGPAGSSRTKMADLQAGTHGPGWVIQWPLSLHADSRAPSATYFDLVSSGKSGYPFLPGRARKSGD